MGKIPVTLITGFLGAGKTTLLNQLIQQNPTTQFAIIENEVGEINIDKELVVNTNECLFELNNGCICCSLNYELGQTLKALIEQPQPFDHLLIEASGIAEPAGIASAFISQQRQTTTFYLDTTIVIVDAKELPEILLQNETIALRQIAFADIMLLNKIDLVEPEQIAKITEILAKINPFVKIYTGKFGEFDATDLLNQNSYETQKLEDKLLKTNNEHHHHAHWTTESFMLQMPLVLDKFKVWFYALLTFQSQNIFRVKGVLHIAHENRKLIFQSVGKQFIIEYGNHWKADEQPSSKIVFIGKNLKREILAKNLEACFE